MSNEPRLLVNMEDGSSLITSERQDEYWIVNEEGQRTKIPTEKAVQIWLHRNDYGASKARARVAPNPLPKSTQLVQPPPIPQDAVAPQKAAAPIDDSSQDSWQEGLLRRLGLNHATIQEAVAADQRKCRS